MMLLMILIVLLNFNQLQNETHMMLAQAAAAACPKHSRSKTPKYNALRSRNQAINIDRFSRIFFPALFTLLNAMYWVIFFRYI